MIGAIIGDIVGSVYEFHNLRSKEFELFGPRNRFTDDTVLTIATSSALLSDRDFARVYHQFAHEYPDRGYGALFRFWMSNPSRAPYGSFGNGAAMRVSPCGFLARSLEEALELAESSARVTHNHAEGIKSARAVAHAIQLGKNGIHPEETARLICNLYGYRLYTDIDLLRRENQFSESAEKTLPVVMSALYASESFEDAIRTGVSLGGDTDTICAIVGSLAEAHFGVPEDIAAKAISYLDLKLGNELKRYEAARKELAQGAAS